MLVRPRGWVVVVRVVVPLVVRVVLVVMVRVVVPLVWWCG